MSHVMDSAAGKGQGDLASGEHVRATEDAELQGRALTERTKELRCLYTVSRGLFETADLDEAFARVVAAIPPGCQYPEETTARLTVRGQVYTSEGFREGAHRLAEPVQVDGQEVGTIEVHYLEDRPEEDEGPFLHEERALLRALAERVGETLARRETEARLRRREAHFRALVESAADMILLLDARGVTRYASPSARQVLGYEPQELAGSQFDLVHPEDRAGLVEVFEQRTPDPDSSARMEVRLRHADGSWRHMDALGRNLLHDPDVQGVLVILRDITERRRLEEELLQAQKMEAVGRLAGGIAHDFNNLLTVIDVQSELLADDLPEGDPRRDDVQEIRRASRHGAALTRQLLAFSRRQVTKPQRFDPCRLVRDLERMLYRLLGEDVDLVTDLPEGIGTICMDRGQLEQILLNLAVNARDAMPSGGRLEVVLRPVEVKQGERDLAGGPYIEMRVSDTGEGMPEGVVEHVFEPFFTTKLGGTGLGLSTVYGIVTQNGGHVRVHSDGDAGTTFHILLPRAGDDATATPSAAPSSRSHGGEETILLVEDDARLRRATRRVLSSLGYSVLEAGGASDALAIVRAHEGPVHLLLSDVVMPEMSGPELAAQVRRERPGIGVLLSSGYSNDAVARQARLDPEAPFLPKPFSPGVLAQTVREALRYERTPDD